MAKFGTPESVEEPVYEQSRLVFKSENTPQFIEMSVISDSTLSEPLPVVETPKLHAWQKPKYSWPKKKR